MKLLKYPYPYKAWFTIANDPDNTIIQDWNELNEYIWMELNLPIGNSLFVKSFNQNLPDQVNLEDHPVILSQFHDIIHTWGDYMHAGKRGFDRTDAKDAIKTLREFEVFPRVWIDHSSFVGNMMHRNQNGAVPYAVDKSGHVYKQLAYTLDLVQEIGITYLWDGTISNIMGQDRRLSAKEYYLNHSSTRLKALVKLLLSSLGLNIKPLRRPSNVQYYKNEFPDGNSFYCFPRYGTWEDADIFGLNNLINPKMIAELIKNEGSMLVYTHLGKRPADKMNSKRHIPDNTRESLRNIKEQFDRKHLMVSPVSTMLDYMVLRDHVFIDSRKQIIEFKPDNIRYKKIDDKLLEGLRFSFFSKSDLKDVRVCSEETELSPELVNEEQNIYSLVF